MPEFSTPHSVKKADSTFTQSEMIRSIRFAIAAEYEAIQIYEEMAENINNKDAVKLIEEIITDEKVHVGNFLQLLRILNPEEEEFYKEGYKETLELLEK
ncbi:rubrerythrin [bacterium]|nr:rubrerythrin [bacterium]